MPYLEGTPGIDQRFNKANCSNIYIYLAVLV